VKDFKVIATSVLCLAFIGCTNVKKVSDYLTIDEASAIERVPGQVAPLTVNPGISPELPAPFRPPFTSINPVRLFDNLDFVGTTAVGAFIVDSGDGLVMFDTGNGDEDAALMADDMKKIGLDPAKIKLIFISHEHFDHYGGVQFFKKNICPNAKVAMSLVGWNMLQSTPMESPYIGKRPQKVDIYLTDRMKIKIGNETFQVVATPGHSPGCMSFIFPVTDHGDQHMAGLMGGSAVWPTQVETYLYKSSIEYFNAFAAAERCDVGLIFHSQESDFAALRLRKSGEPNPLVVGTERFNTIYLEKFRERYRQMIESGRIKSDL
jgi:metallo-beta-lactamase class B